MKIKERLEKFSKPNIQTGCIEWTGTLRNGYGRLVIGSRSDGSRRTVSAHRLAYATYKGEIPKGMFVCHTCDNPACINPQHLFLGTRQDNVNDREEKGRNKIPRKLSDEDVEFIHKNKNVITGRDLAKMFSVSYTTIKHVWRGIVYSHLLPPTPKKDNDDV